MATSGKSGRGRRSDKTTHSRSYPRGVGLDFRKLAGLTLMGYIDHHGMCNSNNNMCKRKISSSKLHFCELMGTLDIIAISLYQQKY